MGTDNTGKIHMLTYTYTYTHARTQYVGLRVMVDCVDVIPCLR